MLIILDWDGTLSDSTKKITECMQSAVAQVGMNPLEDDDIRNIIGLGLPEAIRFLYPGVSDATMNAIKQAYSTFFKEKDIAPSPFFSGVSDTLASLKDDGHTLAVATGKSRQGLNRVLANLGLEAFFHSSRCADETASKPNPLMLAEILTENKHHVDDAVMIGDTEWDMVMADNIDMKKVAVTYGAHSKERLVRCCPDLIVDEFSDIRQWLNDIAT